MFLSKNVQIKILRSVTLLLSIEGFETISKDWDSVEIRTTC
jgi:hypothetical protein